MTVPPIPSCAALLCLAAQVAVAAPAPPAPSAALTTLHERAPAGGRLAYDIVERLTTDFGPRPVGSATLARASEAIAARLRALGFEHVHAEPFTKEGAWVRGAESGGVVAPVARPLELIGLGGSVPTPAEGIEAEVVVYGSLAALEAAPLHALDGCIALVNQPMTRTDSGAGYGAAVPARSVGPSIAAARGALAYLTRSIATGNNRAPHTGALAYRPDAPRIPAAALGVADAELLARLAAAGAHPRVRLALASSTVAAAPAWNVVGEIPGRDPAAGTLVIGGHLDSWDPGEGAIDDAAGVAITIAAARAVADLPGRPRRTIRAVAFGSEETGGSGAAYASAHAAERSALALTAESDLGSGRILALKLPEHWLGTPLAAELAETLAPLGIFLSREVATHGGSDVAPLVAQGVPVAEFEQDATHYFDVHHSADDTLDKVDVRDLAQNVAAWSALLYLAAEAETLPR